MSEQKQIDAWLDQPMRRRDVHDLLLALIVSLDEHKVITIEQFHESFADAIVRKKVNLGQTHAETHALQVWLTTFYKLATHLRDGKPDLP